MNSSRIFQIILLAAIFPSCSSTIQVRKDEPLNNDHVFNYDQVNARTSGSQAILCCVDGSSYAAKGIAVVALDSTVFFEADSGLRHSIATRDLLAIKLKNHGAGAFTGRLSGTLAGLALGIGMSLVVPGSPEARKGLFLPTLGFMAFGAVFGGIAGGSSGATEEYRFEADTTRGTSMPESLNATSH